MPQFFSEDFDGADGTNLGEFRPEWSPVPGSAGALRLENGAAVYNPSASGSAVYYRTDSMSPSPDYSVSADVFSGSVAGNGAGGYAGFFGRNVLGTATFYNVRVNLTTIELYKFVNGSATLLGSKASGFTGAQTYALRLEMIGSSIKVYLNGSSTAFLSVTDTAISIAGCVGLRVNKPTSTSGAIDNLIASTPEGDLVGVSGSLNATLSDAIISSSAQLPIAGALAKALDPVSLSSSGEPSSKASLTKTLAPAVLAASAYIEAEPPQQDGIEGALSKTLSGATLAASASLTIKGALSSTLDSSTLAATATVATQLDISKVHPSRVVVFDGCGSRVVLFEGSGSRVVVFEGSGKRIRINEMDVKVPIKDGEKWKVDRDRDEISYYAADITDELRDRNTVAIQSEVIALPYGVAILEGAEIQIATIDEVERTFVVVKLGDIDGDLPDDWRWVARVPCANGERFDKTTWFNEVDP